MSRTKLDITEFLADPSLIAFTAAAEELFSFLTGTIDLPRGWNALITKKDKRSLVQSDATQIQSDGVAEILFVRNTPIELHFQIDDLATADNYLGKLSLDIRLHVISEPNELKNLSRQLIGTSRTLRSEQILHQFHDEVRAAAGTVAQASSAADLVDGCANEMTESIHNALTEPCFHMGLQAEPPRNIHFTSPAFREFRKSAESAAKREQEHRARGALRSAMRDAQTEHVQHLEQLISRLTQLAEESPDTDLATLMRTFTERERGQLYEALFAAQPILRPTRWFTVVSGTELLYFDPQNPNTPARRIDLPTSAGAARSVQYLPTDDQSHRLWIGASHGVYEIDYEKAECIREFRASIDVEPRGGVNSVAVMGDQVVSSHSELGLTTWPFDQPESPETCLAGDLAGAKTIRGVQSFGGSLFLTVDNEVWQIGPDLSQITNRYTGAAHTLAALSVTSDSIFAGTSEGDILQWDRDLPHELSRIHGGSRRPAESVHAKSAGAVDRLFFTDTTLAVYARVLGDSFVCRYEAGGQVPRRVESAEDWVVAVNDVRDRLLCWHTSNPKHPVHLLPVSQITGRSIQDVAIVPDNLNTPGDSGTT
jgi:hypothetical protein